MPQRKPKTNEGASDSGGKRSQSRKKQIKALEAQLEKLGKVQDELRKKTELATRGWKKYQKSNVQTIKTENTLLKTQVRHSRQVQRLTSQLRRYQNQANKTIKTNRSFAGSITKIVGALGAYRLASLALGQLREIGNARRSLAVSGGLGSLQNVKQFIGKDVAVVSGAQLVDQFLQQGTSQLALGRQPVITKGLLKLQEQLAGVGTDLATKIILDLSASFRDPRRLQGFLGALGRGEDAEKTLRGFQTQQPASVTATLRALNALQVSQVPSTDDPILDTQRELSRAAEKLKTEFENLSATVAGDLVPILKELVPTLKKALEFVGGLSTKKLLLGAGAVALAPSLLRGGATVAGKGLLRGIPSVGRGALGIGRAGVTGAGALPGIASTGGLAAGALLAAPVVAGGALAIHSSKQTEKANREALQAQERASKGVGSLDTLAKLLKASARTDRQRLVAERLRLDSILSGSPSERQRERQGKKRRDVQKQIDLLDRQRTALEKNVQATKTETQSVKAVSKEVDNFADKIKQAPAPESRIDRDLSLLFKRADLELTNLEQQSETALRRSELEIAKIGPYGILAAGSEASRFLDQLQSQEDVLRQILGTLDTSTREGRIEANQLLLGIRNLQREEKELRRHLVTAFLDQSIQQAFGAGRFSKLLVTANQNLGIGLRKNIVGGGMTPEIKKQLFGSIDPNAPKLKSRTALEVLQGRDNPLLKMDKVLNPANMSEITMKGQQRILESVEKSNKLLEKMLPEKSLVSNLDRVFDQSGTVSQEKRVSEPNRKRLRVGRPVKENSADSMIELGKYMTRIGQQMQKEQADIHNSLVSDPTGTRPMTHVQAISP